MKTYVGVKIIEAEPCRYFEFLDKHRNKAYRDTVQPEGGDRDGYVVKYPPDGYISWSPKDVFEAAYVEIPAERSRKILDNIRLFVSSIVDLLK